VNHFFKCFIGYNHWHALEFSVNIQAKTSFIEVGLNLKFDILQSVKGIKLMTNRTVRKNVTKNTFAISTFYKRN
jgi:hypothetical protein